MFASSDTDYYNGDAFDPEPYENPDNLFPSKLLIYDSNSHSVNSRSKF